MKLEFKRETSAQLVRMIVRPMADVYHWRRPMIVPVTKALKGMEEYVLVSIFCSTIDFSPVYTSVCHNICLK